MVYQTHEACLCPCSYVASQTIMHASKLGAVICRSKFAYGELEQKCWPYKQYRPMVQAEIGKYISIN